MEQLYEEHFRDEIEKIVGKYEEQLFPPEEPISLSEILDLETFLEHLLSTISLEDALKLRKQLEISKSPSSVTTSNCTTSPADVHALPITSPEILLHCNAQNKSIYFAESNFTLVEDSFSSASTMGPSPQHSFHQTGKIVDESIAHFTPNHRNVVSLPKEIADSTEKDVQIEEKVNIQEIIVSQGTPLKENIKLSPIYFSPIIGRKSDASLLYSPMNLDQDSSSDETKITLEEFIQKQASYSEDEHFAQDEMGGFETSFSFDQPNELEKEQEVLQQSFDALEMDDSPVYGKQQVSPSFLKTSPPLLYSNSKSHNNATNTFHSTISILSFSGIRSPLHSRNSFRTHQSKQSNGLSSNPVQFVEAKRAQLQQSTYAQQVNTFSKNFSIRNGNSFPNNDTKSSMKHSIDTNNSSSYAEDSFIDLQFDDDELEKKPKQKKKAHSTTSKNRKIPLNSFKK